jgi:hypothetical protein
LDGLGAAIGVGTDQSLNGFSDTVTLETVRDPFRESGNQEQSGDNRGRVLHITSLSTEDGPGEGRGSDESDNAENANNDDGDDDGDETEGEAEPTYDIGISLVNISERGLTIQDIADYDGGEADSGQGTPDAGFAYDWAATERDVVGVNTDHQGLGSPDDVWFFLDDSPEAEETDVSDRSGPFFTNAKPVFRTSYADRDDAASQDTTEWEYEEWNTRTVTEEFEAHGWKELSLQERNFVRVEDNILETYGDTQVVGVGISRGDPFWGPSVLDTYYRNLHVNGERYRFPDSIQLMPPGRS